MVPKPGVYPEKPNGVGGERVILIHSLGHALWSRRRPTHPDLIIDAVERFAPGKYTAQPRNPQGGVTGAGTPA